MGKWEQPNSVRNTDINGNGTIFKRNHQRMNGDIVTYMYVRPRLGSRGRDPRTRKPAVDNQAEHASRARYRLADYFLEEIWTPKGVITEIVSGRDYPLGRVTYLSPVDLGITGPQEQWTDEQRDKWEEARDRMAEDNRHANDAARNLLRAIGAIRKAQLDTDLEDMDLDSVAPGNVRRQPDEVQLT